LHDVRDGENIVAKREKVNELVEFLETSKSTRIHMNPRKHAEVGEKNQPDKGASLWDGGNRTESLEAFI